MRRPPHAAPAHQACRAAPELSPHGARRHRLPLWDFKLPRPTDVGQPAGHRGTAAGLVLHDLHHDWGEAAHANTDIYTIHSMLRPCASAQIAGSPRAPRAARPGPDLRLALPAPPPPAPRPQALANGFKTLRIIPLIVYFIRDKLAGTEKAKCAGPAARMQDRMRERMQGRSQGCTAPLRPVADCALLPPLMLTAWRTPSPRTPMLQVPPVGQAGVHVWRVCGKPQHGGAAGPRLLLHHAADRALLPAVLCAGHAEPEVQPDLRAEPPLRGLGPHVDDGAQPHGAACAPHGAACRPRARARGRACGRMRSQWMQR